jgi:hypothetical protein
MTLFSKFFHQKRTRIELDLTDEQIVQLRQIMDNLPLNRYAHLVVAVLKALPFDHESVAGTPSGADARPAQDAPDAGCGFSLIPFTPRDKAALPHIEQVLGTLEVLDDVCLHGRKYCEECAHKFGPQWLDPQDELLLVRLPHTGDNL